MLQSSDANHGSKSSDMNLQKNDSSPKNVDVVARVETKVQHE